MTEEGVPTACSTLFSKTNIWLGKCTSSFHCLMRVVTAAVRRDGSWNICKRCHEQRKNMSQTKEETSTERPIQIFNNQL
ncbi:hypothetical protein LDENG_00092000 [Lucifuga dentata]|nr:hypothetical protein LDENG_00092000 [Lucifuga dentata]